MIDEILFAKGEEFSEVSRMRITYKKLDRLHPEARYPRIYDGKSSIGLTPPEAQWVVDVLTRLLRES